MRYLKPYESFYHEDDMAREIAGFLDLPIERLVLNDHMDTSMFRIYTVDGKPDAEAVDALKRYMESEHRIYLAWNPINKYGKTIVLSEKAPEEAGLEWLSANFSGLEKVDNDPKGSRSRMLWDYVYVDGESKNVFGYDAKTNIAHIGYNRIWSFLTSVIGLTSEQVKVVVEDWLNREYGLVDVSAEPHFNR